ncbi:MAG: hypothetical protein AAF985_01220 [Bacteroidota bacterium]
MLLFVIQGDWWESLSNTQQVFWAISIIFSVLFIIQFVLSLVGFDGDVDFETDVDSDGVQLDTDFTLFSVRSIIAFFTFFGWTGVLVLNSGGGTWAAIGFATLSGFIAMLIVGYMMYLFSKMSESGTFRTKSALHNTGEVYLKIPSAKSGYGKIHMKIKGAVKEMDAVTEGDALPTGASVRVIEVLDDNLLLVEPIKELLSGQK